MNNLSYFANFGLLQKFFGVGAPGGGGRREGGGGAGGGGGGGQTEVCAQGAKNPRYASALGLRSGRVWSHCLRPSFSLGHGSGSARSTVWTSFAVLELSGGLGGLNPPPGLFSTPPPPHMFQYFYPGGSSQPPHFQDPTSNRIYSI